MSRVIQYREFPPPDTLRRHVRCLWHLKMAAAPGHVDTVYPDGCCEMIAHRLAPMHAFGETSGWRQQERCIFAGQQRSAIRLAAHSDADCLGVRLQPAASAMFPNKSLPWPARPHCRIGGLDVDFAGRFSEAASQADVESAVAAIFALIHDGMRPIDERIESAVAELEASDGTLPIAALVADSGMSERSFQNTFKESVGLSAKEFARIRRLQATIRMLDAADRSHGGSRSCERLRRSGARNPRNAASYRHHSGPLTCRVTAGPRRRVVCATRCGICPWPPRVNCGGPEKKSGNSATYSRSSDPESSSF